MTALISTRWMATLLLVTALTACGGDDSGTGTVTDMDTDSTGMDAGGMSDGSEEDSSTTPADTDDGTLDEEDVDDGLLGLGEPCSASDVCRTNFCFRFAEDAQGFCSQFCLQQQDCGSSDAFDCIFTQNDDDEIARVCVPLDFCLDNDEDGYGEGPGCLERDCDDENPMRNPAQTEICDELDNDCDGVVDGNTVESNVPCDTGIPGVCSAGIRRCSFGTLECETTRFAGREICDNIDNDCDGLTDEDDQGEPLSEICYSGPEGTADVGQCATGVRTCQGGQFSLCIGQALPLLEVCDGIDNDCDGDIDNGMPGTGAACDTGEQGACRAGQTICDAEGSIVCVRQEEPSEEVCDGIDNDCDGEVDEDEEGELLARDCYEGAEETQDVGICVGGVQTCVDGQFSLCIGQALPLLEVCDGIDNDCDG
ncbi:MAG: putative metal-binding motif-containing protein, partial [Myxococcota bacterium]